VSRDHCFARILLDAACGAPWRSRIPAPAWRNAPAPVLREAVRLGEAAIAGEIDMSRLNQHSLALRGKIIDGDALWGRA
ncbi:MAG: N-acetyltransferase, partial [Pseudomonadota bacterium]